MVFARPPELRTGAFIKAHLEAYGPSSISDIHKALKDAIRMERRRRHRLRGPTYHSFYQYFRNLLKLGLVELVAEKPTELIANPEALAFLVREDEEWRLREGAAKRLYGLTDKGRLEIIAWDDPLRPLGFYPRKGRS